MLTRCFQVIRLYVCIYIYFSDSIRLVDLFSKKTIRLIIDEWRERKREEEDWKSLLNKLDHYEFTFTLIYIYIYFSVFKEQPLSLSFSIATFRIIIQRLISFLLSFFLFFFRYREAIFQTCITYDPRRNSSLLSLLSPYDRLSPIDDQISILARGGLTGAHKGTVASIRVGEIPPRYFLVTGRDVVKMYLYPGDGNLEANRAYAPPISLFSLSSEQCCRQKFNAIDIPLSRIDARRCDDVSSAKPREVSALLQPSPPPLGV